MQLHHDHHEINAARYQQIDQRWSAVEDALRIENAERKQDLSTLQEQLQQRKVKQSNLDERKADLLGCSLKKLKVKAQESKQNIEKLFQSQAQFRITHLNEKNQSIQTYLNSGSTFNSTLQQHATNKIKDIASRLQAIDTANLSQTHLATNYIKEEVIGQAQDHFTQEKEKYAQLLNKIASDANKSMDQLRQLMKTRKKQREQSEAKLRVMVAGLVEQLGKMSGLQTEQGQMTYACILKLLEQCCARIQQAQLS